MIQYTETSIIIRQLRHIHAWRCRVRKLVRSSYVHSYAFQVMQTWHRLSEGIRKAGQTDMAIGEHSAAVNYACTRFIYAEQRVRHWMKNSCVSTVAEDIQSRLLARPVQAASMIIITATTLYISLALVFKMSVSIWGWCIYGLLLLSALIGLRCAADWATITMHSAFLNFLYMRDEKN